MSLITGYSSDEDGPAASTKDVFGLSKLPAAKKVRVDEPPSSGLVVQAAPDVLSEVHVPTITFIDSSSTCYRTP